MSLPGFNAEASFCGGMLGYEAAWSFDPLGNRVFPQFCDDPTCLNDCDASCFTAADCQELPPALRARCLAQAIACYRACFRQCCLPCATPPVCTRQCELSCTNCHGTTSTQPC